MIATIRFFLFLCLALMTASGCGSEPDSFRDNEIRLHWEVTSNFQHETYAYNELRLVNNGTRELGGDWSLYFNFMRLIDAEWSPDEADITHINGDFYRITPTVFFDPLPPGDELVIPFRARGATILEVDGPDGAYLVFDDGHIATAEIVRGPFERPEQWHRSPDDAVPLATAEVLYEKNRDLTLLSPFEMTNIVPTPVSMRGAGGPFTLSSETLIRHEEGLENEASFLAQSLEQILGTRPGKALLGESPDGSLHESQNESPGEYRDETDVYGMPDNANTIRLATGTVSVDGTRRDAGEEAYRLEITDTGIEITGIDAAGVFYGIQSLRSFLPVDIWFAEAPVIELPGTVIFDAPGFPYRGLHLDVSRNFQSVETVKKLLDVMAFYKLNRFHFHLTDDEGWRLAINAFPELAEIGGRRGHTLDEREHLLPSYGSGPWPDAESSMGTGWYTRQEYIDILRYAAERHIEVVPEIDVPGHARAALVAMQNRYERLLDEGRDEEAERYRIHDPHDTSEYMSIQRWTDNVINVCQESTYRFLRTVYDELIDMHSEAGAPLSSIHIGGDEVPDGVWEESPQCHDLIRRDDSVDSVDDLMDYFFARSQADLAKRGLTMAAWEEFSLIRDPETGQMVPNPLFIGEAIPYVWSNIWGTGTESYSYQLANAGYQILMNHASNFYFDLSYQKHPEEAGLFWAGFVDTRDPYAFIPFDLYKSGVRDYLGRPMPEDVFDGYPQLTDEGRENILGLQAQLWSETFRTPDRVEYMALPRIIVLAERAWVPEQGWMEYEDRADRLEAMSGAWNEFSNRLGQRELPRLDHMNGGYAYRIPPPGAVVRDGMLHANVAHPGFEIRYTTDGTEPLEHSLRYEDPVAVYGIPEIRLRTFDTRGRGSRTSTLNLTGP